MKIAITGNIGCGKSYVSAFFKALGIPVFDSDREAKALYDLPELAIIAPTIEETALVEFRGRQVPAMLKGVDTTYQQLTCIDSILLDGSYAVWDGAFERCVMGV